MKKIRVGGDVRSREAASGLVSLAQRSSSGRIRARRQRGNTFAAATCAVLLLHGLTIPSFAQQLPTGGAVAAGSASINQSGSTLNVNQSTNQAIINWQSFSVGQGGTVNFNQPSAAASTLNRVLGTTPSSIAGTINAPGSVLLVNPNGIAITNSGVVNVGGFAASTLNIKDEDYLAGRFKFEGNGGSAAVSNAGRINVSDGGFAALLGGQVSNSGVISARLGKVGLGAGEMVTLDFAGDGFLSVAVPSSQIGNLVDGSGALVTNSGKIRANGGQVYLSAATAANILRDAVNVPGAIRTNSVGTRAGKIVINGGNGHVNVSGRLAANGGKRAQGGSIAVAGASVTTTGKLSANGKTGGAITVAAGKALSVSGTVAAKGRDGQGGRIDLSGTNIALAGAAIDASGATGGGLVRIGGTFQGGNGNPADPLYIASIGRFGALPAITSAQTVTIDAGSRIDVSARRNGDGGTAIVWSDVLTEFAGTIAGKGGASGGHGGFAEVSGHEFLNFTGSADLLAAAGSTGTLLLDPRNVVISTGTNAVTCTGGVCTPTTNGAILNVSTLTAALASSNVVVNTGSTGTQEGTITVSSAITWNAATTLTLNGIGEVAINANITNSNAGGGLVLTSSAAGIYLQSGTINVATMTATAATQIVNASGTYTNASGTVVFNAGTAAGIGNSNYGVFGWSGTITAANMTLNAQGLVYSGFRINAANLLVTGAGTFNLFTASTINQTSSTNTIGTLAANVTGTLNVSNNANLVIGSVNGVNGVTADTFRLAFAGTRTLGQTQAITANVMTLQTTNVASAYTLANAANRIGTFAGTVGANGTLQLAGTNGLNIGGTLADDNGNTIATGITAGTLTLTNTGTVTQAGRISATNLALLGAGGNYQLTSASNVIGTLAANTGSIYVARTSAAALTVGSVGGTTGITTTGSVTLAGLSTATNGVAVNQAITSGGDIRILSVGGVAVAANITATGGTSIYLVPDTSANGATTRAVSFTGGARAITSGAGSTSIYFNTASYIAPSQNYTGNVTGTLRPYMYVTTLDNLQSMSTNLSGSYALNKDIDASATASWNGGAGFVPVGTAGSSFTGNFDGLGHTISGLVINRPGTSFVGLFGATNNASISNVGMLNGSITGGVATGALIGYQTGGSLSSSYSSASVAGSIDVGGLVGFADGAIRYSYSTGNVSGSDSVGGIAGYLSGTLTQSYATGAITGGTTLGGLVGLLDTTWATVSASYWDTQTSGRANAFGSGSAGGATGLTSAQFTVASNFAGWTFGTIAGGSGWVIVDVNSTLNNAGGAAGATRPMLLSEASTNGVITNAHQLQLMALNLGGSYTLGANIDMSETARASGVWINAGFVPIGYAESDGTGIPSDATFGVVNTNPFYGNFNGQTFTISNLTIYRPTTDYVGLFGYTYLTSGNQTIQNVTLAGGSITGRDHVGALVGGNRGYAADGSTLPNLNLNANTSSVAMTGRDFVGGLYGSLEHPSIATATTSGAVTGRDYVGGIVGWTYGNILQASDLRSSSVVNGRSNIGGAAGYLAISLSGASYATGNVTGTGNNVGGFVGDNEATFTGNSVYATGNVSGVNNVGGLAGLNGNTISWAFATGAVTGVSNVGGLVGNNDATTLSTYRSGFVDLSFATGIVNGVTNVGGLVGYNTNLIGALSAGGTYATGAVYGTTNVGGLVGSNVGDSVNTFGRINSSYAIGYVSGTTNVGGLVGNSVASGTGTFRGYVLNSYFNSQTTGQANGLGAGTTGTSGIATNAMVKTTAQLQAALQTGFSTTPWGLVTNTSLPYFKWLYGSAPQVVSGTAYNDFGGPVTFGVAGSAASLLVSGLTGTAATVAASAVGSTGADGYFYFLVPGSTFTAGSPKQVLVYTAGASGGALFNQNTAAHLTGQMIYGTWFRELAGSSATLLSSVDSALALAVNGNAAATTRLASLSNQQLYSAAATFRIDRALSVAGSLILSGSASTSWSQTAAISAANLSLQGSANSYDLMNAGNAIGTLAANTGAVAVRTSGSLNIGSLFGTAGVTATNAVTLVAGGDIIIAAASQIRKTGVNASNVTLAAAGNFINNRGGDAITVAGTGRWLVYSAGPDNDVFGALNSNNTALWNATYDPVAPVTVSATGNRYLFATAAVLTITTTDTSKTFGDDAASDVTSRYTVSGYKAGVANAFLGDTAATALTGLTVTSTGSGVNADVNTYAITAASATGLNGYTISYANNGVLTVNQATLTVTADAASRIYGDANPALSGSIAGFKNGQSETTFGGGIWTTVADSATGVGTTAISGALANASPNYVLVQAVANATALAITPRAITVTADAQSRPFGNANPALSYQVTTGNLVNGDTLAGALATFANASSPAGDYAIVQNTLTGGNNYALTYVSNNLTVTPAPANPTANPPNGNPPAGNNPSTFNPQTPANPPQTVSITFENQGAPVFNISFTPPATRTAAANDVVTSSRGNGAAQGSNNGRSYPPISQFDANQYSDFKLPDFAKDAGPSAIFVMLARAADPDNAAAYMIDKFWSNGAPVWAAPGSLADKVSFTDGTGNPAAPAGNAGLPIVPGTTDMAGLLKSGPVMISGGQPARWLLATAISADGKGIVANDPATGKQVLLAYDTAARSIGGIVGTFEGGRLNPVASSDSGNSVASELQGFNATAFIAVTVR